MKRIVLIAVFTWLVVCSRAATITYVVTSDDYLGGAGSFNTIITQAAVDITNGHDVIVNLNAPGLIKTQAWLTGSSSFFLSMQGSGSLIIQKDPSLPASNVQGFMFYNYDPLNLPSSCRLWIMGNQSSNKHFIIRNLKFKGFDYVMWTVNNSLYNTEISNCQFEDNIASIILTSPQSNIQIKNNTCTTSSPTVGGYFLSLYIPLSGQAQSTVTNNYVNTPGASYGIVMETQNVSSISSAAQCTFHISNNTFENMNIGINWRGLAQNNVYNASNLNVRVENNTMKNCNEGFDVYNPFKTLVFDKNTLLNNLNDVLVYLYNPWNQTMTGNNMGIDFIGSNSLGLSTFNSGNVFLGSNKAGYSTFFIGDAYVNQPSSFFGSGVNLTGLKLPGKVEVEYMNPVSIQQNTITTNSTDKPIWLKSLGNLMIDGPSISLANFTSPTQISVTYQLNGNQHLAANADFDVEFFRADANGNLLNFLGRQTVNSAGLSTNQTYALTLPAGVVFSAGDKLAATATSKGNAGGATPRGTSMITMPLNCNAILTAPANSCLNSNTPFNAVSLCGNPPTVLWNFGDGSMSANNPVTHNYGNTGVYTVTLSTQFAGQGNPVQTTQAVQIDPCQPPQPCVNCIGSFAPDPGNYMLNLWVREDVSPLPLTYNNAKVRVSFTGSGATYLFGTNLQKNKIIEGWQRIEESFTIPAGATHVNIELVNAGANGAADVYFDDIRIFPVDGQMKTYVYDPLTMRLSAVLDENNYATFYEYDEEGKLIRLKKETEKGIMTIKESRESLKKK